MIKNTIKKMKKAQRFLHCNMEWDAKSVQKDASGKITIKGFANTPDKDRVGDVVLPSAFKKTLEGYMENPVVLFQHNWDKIIGKCIKAEVQEEGLYVECEISGAKDVDDVRTKIAEGSLKTFSIGYNEIDADYDESSGCNLVKELELLEISVVTIPCNPKAKFTTEVTEKEGEEIENKSLMEDDFFDFLAEALKGLSSTEDIDGVFLKELRDIHSSSKNSKSKSLDEDKGGPGSGRKPGGGAGKPQGGESESDNDSPAAKASLRRAERLTKNNAKVVAFAKKSEAIKRGIKNAKIDKEMDKQRKQMQQMRRDQRKNGGKSFSGYKKKNDMQSLMDKIVDFVESVDELSEESVNQFCKEEGISMDDFATAFGHLVLDLQAIAEVDKEEV